MSGFEFNEEGMAELQRQIQQKLDSVVVPTDGSEEDAVRSVEAQYKEIGIEGVHHQDLLQLVRDARNE
jgi:hypothetical protein